MVFAEAHGATVKHYRDDSGREADAVFQLSDGRYALIEIKAGMNAIPAAEANLLKFDQMIARHNEAVLKGLKHPGVPINWDIFNGHYTGYGKCTENNTRMETAEVDLLFRSGYRIRCMDIQTEDGRFLLDDDRGRVCGS